MDFEALLYHGILYYVAKLLDDGSYYSLAGCCRLLHTHRQMFPLNLRATKSSHAYRLLEREANKVANTGNVKHLLEIGRHLTSLNCEIRVVCIKQKPIVYANLFPRRLMRRSLSPQEAFNQEREITFILLHSDIPKEKDSSGGKGNATTAIEVQVNLQGKEKKVAIELVTYTPLCLRVVPRTLKPIRNRICYGISIQDLDTMLISYLYAIEAYRLDSTSYQKDKAQLYKVLTDLSLAA